MLKAYKYRLYPNQEQKVLFDKTFGCCRFVYNWALETRTKAYQTDKTRIGWVELTNRMTALKKDADRQFLTEAPAQALVSAVRNMESAFVRFFREKKGFPKFKSKKNSRQSFQLPQNVELDFESWRIRLPKAGWVRIRNHRKFEGRIGMTTVSRSASGKYYVSVLVDDGKALPEPAPITWDTSVGVDVGLKDFAVCSDGKVFGNPKYLESNEKRLKVYQRRLARKQRGSKRRERVRRALARCHEKIANRRANFLHHVTSMLVRENQTVIIEDLNVEGMLKNHCLAKGISSVAWSGFFRQLVYKCRWAGKNLIRIGRFEPSSRLCTCGYKNDRLTLKDRKWVCPECGAHHDRDLLAAKNIKLFGLQAQNLVGLSPAVSGAGRVESPALAGAQKREYVQFPNV